MKHLWRKSNKGFEGWYFKHQAGNEMIAFIPGRAESGPFIQMIGNCGARQFPVPNLTIDNHGIHAGNCLFSYSGCTIDLPGIRGRIEYGKLAPLCSDIMGPFRYLPMECRHGVISMAHSLSGSLKIDGQIHGFNDGTGYIEKDSGTSFPSSYIWLQCNDFSEPCSIMVSIAHIPIYSINFTGCICAILYKGHEYRLATYRHVRIHKADSKQICLSQGKLLLKITMKSPANSHPLRAPVNGQMSGTIRENTNTCVHVCLWNHGTPVIDLHSAHAAFEFVPAIPT
ncbi:tocopherol cyclase family protein [Hespellia stercorisuis]|uniref:Tocopherol cyclase n=1 Tax=Hespellia stercorisuis DSM 15480 TaxID=1121950 RepID=A0A1M6IB72_9FIRM|nr:tocopherol cyclase family protein [Hespellia stercorisuis]SHJ31681.1 Tocopherol cyclase [Hespellia stercorisuis DSM 15480]